MPSPLNWDHEVAFCCKQGRFSCFCGEGELGHTHQCSRMTVQPCGTPSPGVSKHPFYLSSSPDQAIQVLGSRAHVDQDTTEQQTGQVEQEEKQKIHLQLLVSNPCSSLNRTQSSQLSRT